MSGKVIEGRRSISRREFARKSLFAVAAVGAAGIGGYIAYDSRKLKTINNVLRMGHCAPSIMQTLLEINNLENPDLVLYCAAMAGGIAGANTECGALTAPMMFISLTNNEFTDISGRLNTINKAQLYVNEFNKYNKALVCNRIRQGDMRKCRKTMYNFYGPYSRAAVKHDPMSNEKQEAYSLILNAFDECGFHCSNTVLSNLDEKFKVKKDLTDSTWIFIGGLAMLNRTCGALAAGVAALSSISAEIENSYSRVRRMNKLLKKQNDKALNDDINNFNRSIRYSDELGSWFRSEFGAISCHDIWNYDFSRIEDAKSYISGQCVSHCTQIAKRVARQVSIMA